MVERIIPGARITIGPGLLKHTDRVDAPQKGALDIERARSELGYQPRYDLFKGLQEYVDAYAKGGAL